MHHISCRWTLDWLAEQTESVYMLRFHYPSVISWIRKLVGHKPEVLYRHNFFLSALEEEFGFGEYVHIFMLMRFCLTRNKIIFYVQQQSHLVRI